MHFLNTDAITQFGAAGKIAHRYRRIGPKAVNRDINVGIGYIFQFVFCRFWGRLARPVCGPEDLEAKNTDRS